MDCLQQFNLFPNPTDQKIEYFPELQELQSTHIQEDLSKEFYFFETTSLETILEYNDLEPEEHQSSNCNFCVNHVFSNEDDQTIALKTTTCAEDFESKDTQKEVHGQKQCERNQFQPCSFESLTTSWKITLPSTKNQRRIYPEFGQNDKNRTSEVARRRRSRRRTGGTRSDPLSPSAENFRLEIGKYKISILVLRHQGNHGCNPKDPTLFYYQARIRNIYPQRHLWAGWEV